MTSHEPHHLPVEHQKPDEWHRHSADEGRPQAEHAAIASPVTLFGAFIVISSSVAITVVIIIVFYTSYNSRHQAQIAETTVLSNDYVQKRDRVELELSSYGWADAQAGTVRIPLEKATERTIEKYKAAK